MRQLTPSMQAALARIVGTAIEARQRADGVPFLLAHLVTNRCMCECASCLWKDNESENVPLEKLQRFYAEASELGFAATAISGGEPFLRKDLGELTRFIKHEAKLNIVLVNTGWYLKRRMDEVLPNIDMMVMSVDSARAERHDQIRGLPGLFDRVVEGVRLVKANYPDVPVQFNTCIQKGVAEEIDPILDLAVDLGVRVSFDVITEFRHGELGPVAQTEMGMPLHELQEVCAKLVDRKREGAPVLNSEQYFEYFANGKPGYRCHLPKVVMFVNGQGDVENCLNLNNRIANITEMPLAEIMKLHAFRQLRTDAERCSSCNSPTMVDVSKFWENPQSIFEQGGIQIG